MSKKNAKKVPKSTLMSARDAYEASHGSEIVFEIHKIFNALIDRCSEKITDAVSRGHLSCYVELFPPELELSMEEVSNVLIDKGYDVTVAYDGLLIQWVH